MSIPTRSEFEAMIIAKAWKDQAFKQRLLADPKTVYAEELGQELSNTIDIRVLEESRTTRYLVLPASSDAGVELSDVELDAVAGGYEGDPAKPKCQNFPRPTRNPGQDYGLE